MSDLVERLKRGAQLMQSIAKGHGYGEGMSAEQLEHYRVASFLLREAAAALSCTSPEAGDAGK